MAKLIKRIFGPSKKDIMEELGVMRSEHREWAKEAEISKTRLMQAFVGLSLRMNKLKGGDPADIQWLEDKIKEYREAMTVEK